MQMIDGIEKHYDVVELSAAVVGGTLGVHKVFVVCAKLFIGHRSLVIAVGQADALDAVFIGAFNAKFTPYVNRKVAVDDLAAVGEHFADGAAHHYAQQDNGRAAFTFAEGYEVLLREAHFVSSVGGLFTFSFRQREGFA